MTRLRAALLLALAALLVLPAGASAAFHFMKVSEVYAGDTADPDAHFIELQMYSPNPDRRLRAHGDRIRPSRR